MVRILVCGLPRAFVLVVSEYGAVLHLVGYSIHMLRFARPCLSGCPGHASGLFPRCRIEALCAPIFLRE